MDCHAAREALLALDPDLRTAEIEGHLDRCPACRDVASRIRARLGDLWNAGPVSPSPEVWIRIRASLRPRRWIPTASAAAALLAVAILYALRPVPDSASPTTTSAAAPDPYIDEWLQAAREADAQRILAAEKRLERLPGAVEAVRKRRAEVLSKAGLDLDRTLIEAAALLSTHRMEAPLAVSEAERGRLDPAQADVWCLTFLEGNLERAAAWSRGEPVLKSLRDTLLSFERFAERGEWAAAVRCWASGDEREARAGFEIIRSARAGASGDPTWWQIRCCPEGHELAPLTSDAPPLYRRAVGDSRHQISGTVAIARWEVRGGEVRIRGIVAGDEIDPEEGR